MLEIHIKNFNELNIDQLHDLLRLRSEVFVVEQDCVYQDIDGKDKLALHVLGYKADELVAYARAFKPGDYFAEAAIGRVVVKKSARASKFGYDIMKATIEYLEQNLKAHSITLSAQTYLKNFYENLGFKKEGEPYLEDGIPHVLMVKT